MRGEFRLHIEGMAATTTLLCIHRDPKYHLGLLDGIVVADEIKQVRPQLPIVMLVDYAELSQGALKSVDVLVAKSDGPHSLLATIHAIFRKKPSREYEAPRAKGRRHQSE
jgi:DNA-binding response OmpR family regulator